MNYNNLSLDTALSREFSKMGMTVKGLKEKGVAFIILFDQIEHLSSSLKDSSGRVSRS